MRGVAPSAKIGGDVHISKLGVSTRAFRSTVHISGLWSPSPYGQRRFPYFYIGLQAKRKMERELPHLPLEVLSRIMEFCPQGTVANAARCSKY
jgi:hypothetical protein